MKLPEEVYSRREVLIKEHGFTAFDVPADGFHRDGFEVVGTFPDLGRPILEMNSMPRTKILWADDAERARAVEAIEGDFAESFGLPIPGA